MSAQMVQVQFTKSWNGYRAGEVAWFRADQLEGLARLGVIALEREAPVETAVPTARAEYAVTRRRRRRA